MGFVFFTLSSALALPMRESAELLLTQGAHPWSLASKILALLVVIDRNPSHPTSTETLTSKSKLCYIAITLLCHFSQ